MLLACHTAEMSNVQVKNIPDDVHEQLRARAAQHGATISDYVLELIRRDLRGPGRREWIESVLTSPKLDTGNAAVLASIDDGRRERTTR
jgi:plasmid stability protein